MDNKEFNVWMKQAEKDFDTVMYNLDGEKFDAGLFFLQQSCEKCLKALYIKKYKDLLKIYDLVLLARKLRAPIKIVDFCKLLAPAFAFTRYPDVAKDIDVKNLDKFVYAAKEILGWVKEKI